MRACYVLDKIVRGYVIFNYDFAIVCVCDGAACQMWTGLECNHVNILCIHFNILCTHCFMYVLILYI